MAGQMRKWNPGDAANAFVRVILSDAGLLLGGLTEEQWRETLDRFEGRCAYTGAPLPGGEAERDHAIPMNRKHCGLHLYGNVLPATKEANRRKGSRHYRDFVEDRDRLERIEMFIRESGYWDAVAGLGDLSRYCEAQYRTIDALCRVNRKYLEELLPRSIDEEATPFHAAQDDPALGDKPLRLPTGGSSSGDRRRREGLQEIVRDLMRALLEDFPEALDGETINLLATSKNLLGLKIGNHTLIRRIRDGRQISGHGRYWARPYGGRWYVCSQWWKADHRHNARRLAAWVDSLVNGMKDAAVKDCLQGIFDRLLVYGA